MLNKTLFSGELKESRMPDGNTNKRCFFDADIVKRDLVQQC